jgi:hypothetical protein
METRCRRTDGRAMDERNPRRRWLGFACSVDAVLSRYFTVARSKYNTYLLSTRIHYANGQHNDASQTPLVPRGPDVATRCLCPTHGHWHHPLGSDDRTQILSVASVCSFLSHRTDEDAVGPSSRRLVGSTVAPVPLRHARPTGSCHGPFRCLDGFCQDVVVDSV